MDMDQWLKIRRRVLWEGVSQRQILRETGMRWGTLKRILAHPYPRRAIGDVNGRHAALERTSMMPTLCHDNLLSDATIPQPHYLIHWSKKAGVSYLRQG